MTDIIINKLGKIIKELQLELKVSMQGKRFLIEVSGIHPITYIPLTEYEVGEELFKTLVATYWGLRNFSAISEWVHEMEEGEKNV